jgi:hypothetical protein
MAIFAKIKNITVEIKGGSPQHREQRLLTMIFSRFHPNTPVLS